MANRDEKTPENAAHFVLDITGEVCPLTFVRTKLLIERMAVGQTADVLMRGAEPLANVPRAVEGLGHHVLEVVPLVERGGDNGGVHRMRFRKAASQRPPVRDRGS
jgi:TusA-related sulfurtransferase